jgi:dihydroorotase
MMINIYRPRFLILFLIFLALMVSGLVHAQYDLLLKGGHLIDPANEINGIMDIAVTDGKIAGVAPGIDPGKAGKTIDISGYYITPGLIDMHVHVFMGNEPGAYIADGATSVMPDGFTFRSGVTTVVDAGSAGWRNFEKFREQTIDKAETRVLALLNIAGTGMRSRFQEQDVSDMNPEMTAYMITRLYPEVIVGIKSAHYWGDFTQVDKAVEAGKLAGVPVMVDFGEHNPPNSIKSLFLDHLRPGDIFTHTYAHIEEREPVVDDNGKVKPFVFEAVKKGIVFDVGHGGGSFTWEQAVPAIKQGFLPTVISTDLHTQSMNAAMKDLCNVLSKFLAMGMSLEEVITRATLTPSQVINRPDLGHLSEGAEADITVLNLREGDFGFLDIRGEKFNGNRKLEAELTIRAGKIVWDLNGISAKPYQPR